MDYLNDGYVIVGGFILEGGIQLQFGKAVDGSYNIVAQSYVAGSAEYDWAKQQLENWVKT